MSELSQPGPDDLLDLVRSYGHYRDVAGYADALDKYSQSKRATAQAETILKKIKALIAAQHVEESPK